jgi:simple sugar transport system permease protein
MIGAGMAAGALLLLLPALAKTRLGVDEVVTTLLLNFIALLFVSMMLDGPMKDPTAMGWPQSVPIRPSWNSGRLLERSACMQGC